MVAGRRIGLRSRQGGNKGKPRASRRFFGIRSKASAVPQITVTPPTLRRLGRGQEGCGSYRSGSVDRNNTQVPAQDNGPRSIALKRCFTLLWTKLTMSDWRIKRDQRRAASLSEDYVFINRRRRPPNLEVSERRRTRTMSDSSESTIADSDPMHLSSGWETRGPGLGQRKASTCGMWIRRNSDTTGPVF